MNILNWIYLCLDVILYYKNKYILMTKKPNAKHFVFCLFITKHIAAWAMAHQVNS